MSTVSTYNINFIPQTHFDKDRSLQIKANTNIFAKFCKYRVSFASVITKVKIKKSFIATF